MVFLDIAGAIALILFGIRFLRKGLDRFAGHRLHRWMGTMQQDRARALLTGFAFGSVAPSSTAQTLFALQLLNAGQLAADRIVVFLLGANIGITITVQLISFRFFDYYSLFLVFGLLGFQLGRTETVRGIGQSILGLGFIFLAMALTGTCARQLAGNADFETLMNVATHHRVALILFAALATMAMQSSTASIGLTLALGEAGAIDLSVVIAVVLGANLGLGLTSLVAGWRTWEGRRLAVTILVLKCVVVGVILLGFDPLVSGVGLLPGSLSRHGADLHTAFNLVVALVGIAGAGALAGWLGRLFKPAPAPTPAGAVPTHLDPRALEHPAFALANASRETLRLADEIRTMLVGCWDAYQQTSASLARQVRQRDDRVDELHGAIKQYLSQIPAEALNPRDSELRFGLLHFAGQLEAVGDIIDKDLCTQTLKHCERPTPLPPEDAADLAELQRRVARRLDMAISVLTARERNLARQFLHEGETLKNWCIDVQRRHYQRLNPNDGRALELSTYFLDMFNALRRISGHLNSIGHTVVLARTA
ncbi:MAG TPA: Na/Pi cotransporter family protein [Opitutaceae bacterium]|nr:Na/Pi cotransporter family protein [Opitutaceae bacterium]